MVYKEKRIQEQSEKTSQERKWKTRTFQFTFHLLQSILWLEMV